jgi:propionyl-CoA carboxylase alpha chain/3-methylcrotonyl-CoA carboxylase alpha subunit/acetyl-CoA/propionyl-CoA carboxylase biotin carboxyl carrier protein
MLKKVLIANRGEIACRIIRCLRELGVGSIAVFHHEDRHAPFIELADQAVRIDAAMPAAAYLDQEQLIRCARAAGADGVHPGYGFLSENAGFAERVTQAGLNFIGPEGATIRLMGDKIRARQLATELGVPCAPSVTQSGSLESFIAAAAQIGFPLLIKAAAGGGGKGMRIVTAAQELSASAEIASAEAKRYFGDGRIYAELYVNQPRHIEVQVLGDGAGNVVHLYERECSIQRRYQKIIEECPAPNLPVELRERICAAAVRIATAVRYRNAGTIEFILAPDGQFYFLEMNTRLQVEHPVTEQALGIDLVAAQIRIACGEGLPFLQKQLQVRAHAIECRICAEEPDHDFRPATGKVGLLRLPSGVGLRFDGGIREGQLITAAFDSMLAKLVATGASREQARGRLLQGLAELVILGVPTNIDYLARLLGNEQFRLGRLHTGFIVEQLAALAARPPAAGEQAAALLAAALADSDFRRTAFDVPEPHASIGAWAN